MEWLSNVESILFIELTISWLTLPLISIDNVPLLMDLSVLGFIALNVSAFGISSTLNVEVFVHTLFEDSDVFSFKLEHLPPS